MRKQRVIIAGSRDINSYNFLHDAVMPKSGLDINKIKEVVSGGARGVDKLGEGWAKYHDIPCRVFEADWETYGKSAGYKRNEQMAEYADILVALWDGKSKGTKHMIDLARKYGLKVIIFECRYEDRKWKEVLVK